MLHKRLQRRKSLCHRTMAGSAHKFRRHHIQACSSASVYKSLQANLEIQAIAVERFGGNFRFESQAVT
jgi:hypothetical protein